MAFGSQAIITFDNCLILNQFGKHVFSARIDMLFGLERYAFQSEKHIFPNRNKYA